MPPVQVPPETGALLDALLEVLRREGTLPNARAPVAVERRRRQVVVRALRTAARAEVLRLLRRAARPGPGDDPEQLLVAASRLVQALCGLFPRVDPPPYRLNGFYLERWDGRQRRYLPYPAG